jgi:tryptophan-rich sensory protein
MATANSIGRPVWKLALLTVPGIVVVGILMGAISNSGFENGWYAALQKPSFQPPSWAFGVVWTILYALMGIALAMILAQPSSGRRNSALLLFFVQLALNFSWSPLFFGARMIDVALVVLVVMLALAIATTVRFFSIRQVAGILLIPYLAWLCLATALNYETGRLNPGADSAPLGLTGA